MKGSEELREKLKGILAVTTTPFKENYDLDEEGLRKHTQFLVKEGVNGIISMGSTGESHALTFDERKRIMQIVREATPKEVPCIICCNYSATRQVLELSKLAQEIGADGLMILPTYYRKPSEQEIVEFYRSVFSAVDIGVILYNNPFVTQVDMSCKLLKYLIEIGNVVGIKECTPDIFKFEQVVRNIREVPIFSGHDIPFEPYSILMGTAGYVSVIANFMPRAMVKLYNHTLKGEFVQAQAIHEIFGPFIEYMISPKYSAELVPVKAAVNMAGLPAGPTRPPILPLPEEDRGPLQKVLNEIKREIGK
jgi:4-hydroxy-tetrahydrodipicolinate synthase